MLFNLLVVLGSLSPCANEFFKFRDHLAKKAVGYFFVWLVGFGLFGCFVLGLVGLFEEYALTFH